MQISSTISSITPQYETDKSSIKPLYTEKISQDEVDAIKKEIAQNTKDMIEKSTLSQSVLDLKEKNQFTKNQEEFESFLKDIGYEGQSLDQLSQEQAKELVSEDGFFGIDKTSQRMADFVINGANGDEGLLKAGRDGILQGYEDAKEMWGGELPEISQKTVDAALQKVDMTMNELGFSILDTEV